MKKFIIIIIAFLIASEIFAFVGLSVGGKVGGFFSLSPQPAMSTLPFIESNDKNSKKMGTILALPLGLNGDISFRFPGNFIGITIEGNLGVTPELMMFNEGVTDVNSLYFMTSFLFDYMTYITLSVVDRDLRKSAFFIGTGSGTEMRQYSQYLNGSNENLLFSPSTTNFTYFALGYEKLIHKGNPKDVSYHRNALKIKPRVFAGVGFTRNDISVKFNLDTKKIIINTSSLTTAGYPEFRIGADVSISFALDFDTFKRDYIVSLSDESSLIKENDDFNFKDLSQSKVYIRVINKGLYSTNFTKDVLLQPDEFENEAALYIAKALENSYSYIRTDSPDDADYEMCISLDKLNINKKRGLSLVSHSLDTTVYIFQYKNDVIGKRVKKSVMEGTVKAQKTFKIPSGHKGSLSALLEVREENVSSLLNLFVSNFVRDFITPDMKKSN